MAVKYYDLNSKTIQLWASLSMGFVFLLIGVPIWWKTTEVYRADLPYSQIEKLTSKSQIKMTIFVNVDTGNSDHDAHIQSTLELLLKEQSVTVNHLIVNYEVKLNSAKGVGINIKISENHELKKNSIHAAQNTLSCFVKSSNLKDYDNVLINIAYFITESIVQEEKLDHVVHSVHTNLEKTKKTNIEERRMQTLPASSHLDILFSVICPEPHITRATWNIGDAVEKYINPIINKLAPVMHVKVGSQILLYSSAMGKPLANKTSNGDIKNYYFTETKLSRFVNPIEARLGSQQSPNPTLNFVAYLTPRKYCPLHIQLNNGKLSLTNTFLVPRWGAVLLHNDCTSKIAHLDEHALMRVFVAQFKLLLGIDHTELTQTVTDCDIIIDEIDGFHAFQLEHFYLSRTVEQIAITTHTLSSIGDLLEKITNIVINDHVAENIFTAVDALTHATSQLAIGELYSALNHSNQAFHSAEQAFFDSTILELLYFPEDQKFAIYVPLFLPISIPLLTSFAFALRTLLAMRKQNKQKSD